MLGSALVLLAGLAACSPEARDGSVETDEDGALVVRLREPGPPVAVVDRRGPGPVSAGVSRALYASAPVVVLARAGDGDGVTLAARQAGELGVPMLVVAGRPGGQRPRADESPSSTSASSTPSPSQAPTPGQALPRVVRSELSRLGTQTVLTTSPDLAPTLEDLADVEAVTDPDELPEVHRQGRADDLSVLVRTQDGDTGAGAAAASASAEAAGARVVPVEGSDPRADPDAITALARHEPAHVLAAGAGFGPVERLTGRLDVVRTGTQLPGGGQVLFPGRRLVAMYGHPGAASLGVLGEQDLDASIDRAEKLASQYRDLSDDPVVPAFEIIATVAQASPGKDGDYSGESTVAELRPWVERAREAGLYVVLDLQPGRADFLDQAQRYEELLRLPHVGLALDPEWRMTASQVPAGQIGSVSASEINDVTDWLADLTERHRLPQKLVVLHQFQLGMIRDEQDLDLDHDSLRVLIHMDGQGSPDLKDGTWQAVTEAAPAGMPFGWKNFYDEDSPMFTPTETMAKQPTPVMISYQ